MTKNNKDSMQNAEKRIRAIFGSSMEDLLIGDFLILRKQSGKNSQDEAKIIQRLAQNAILSLNQISKYYKKIPETDEDWEHADLLDLVALIVHEHPSKELEELAKLFYLDLLRSDFHHVSDIDTNQSVALRLLKFYFEFEPNLLVRKENTLEFIQRQSPVNQEALEHLLGIDN